MSTGSEEGVHLRKYLTGIIGNAPFGIVTLSAKQEVGIVNSDAVQLLGFKGKVPGDLIDLNYDEVFANIPELLNTFEGLLNSRKNLKFDLNRIEVNQYTINIKVRELFNGSLLIIENITKQAELENQLRHQATHDSLTSLGNRQQFEERVTKCINSTKNSRKNI